MRAAVILAYALFVLMLALAPAAAEKRVALIVGNGAYQHVRPLTNPRNDAELIAQTLRTLGWSLIGDRAQVDLDKAGFDSVVQTFSQQIQGADVSLFYYAGHGLQVRGTNYLVPVGANPTREADVDFQMLDMALVLRQMEVSGTKLNLVILDACRNNPFGGRGLWRANDGGLAQMKAPEGTLISYATQPGNVALDGADGNSPYTKALAQTMRKQGLGIFDTFNEVGLAVKKVTGGSQQPWVSNSPIDGSFYFSGAPAAPIAGNVPQSADPAERAWAVVQNTTSVAILEDFVRQFGNTPYGSMARARVEELKKTQVAVVAPVPPPTLVQPTVGVFPPAPGVVLNYPTKRITIVVPFGAGSVTDILARIFAEDMGRRWNQQIIVENRPGLAGNAAVAKSAPDGYTLMLTSNGHTVAGLVTKDPPFDPVKDFAGITRLASAPLYLIANPSLPAKTLKEVIELAKAQPGKLNFSSPGLASTTFIAGALFRKAAGINMMHVPFRSAPDAVTAVIRGDVQFYFAPVNLAKEQSEGGKVVAIAAATAKRIPDLPNVPTFTEAGLPFVYDSWFGLIAPAGTPKPILDKISKDWAESLKTPEMKAKLAAQFVIAVSDTPAAFDKIIADETAKLTAVFKEAGITN